MGKTYRVVATYQGGRVETIEATDERHARKIARGWRNQPGLMRPENVEVVVEDVA